MHFYSFPLFVVYAFVELLFLGETSELQIVMKSVYVSDHKMKMSTKFEKIETINWLDYAEVVEKMLNQ